MANILTTIKNFILDLLFPSCCINCGRESSYLCEDCQSLIEVLENLYCPVCGKRLPAPSGVYRLTRSTLNYTTTPPVSLMKQEERERSRLDSPASTRRLRRGGSASQARQAGVCKKCKNKSKLNGLYSAASYQNPLVKKIITQFKYPPLIKKLAVPLANLIITHFQLICQNPKAFIGFILIPVPLHKKRLKQRGFNQSEEISKELSNILKLPLVSNVLIKTKKTLPQSELSKTERQENIKEAFFVKNKSKIKNQKILLIDDVYTTGSTMSECARVLKEAGAKEVWGVVVARGE